MLQRCAKSFHWSYTEFAFFSKEDPWCIRLDSVSFVWQSDGNLVAYADRLDNETHVAVWATNTEGRGDKLMFQTDGNVVVYDNTGRALAQMGVMNTKGTKALRYDWVMGDKVIWLPHGGHENLYELRSYETPVTYKKPPLVLRDTLPFVRFVKSAKR